MTHVTRLFDFAQYQLDHAPLEKAFNTKFDGQWVSTSTAEFIRQANSVSKALLDLGVKPNDKIALISMSNRTEWSVLDMAVLQIGAQTVPIYPTISKEDYAYILNHSEAKYCFVSCDEVLDKVLDVTNELKHLKEIYSFDQLKRAKHWSELRDKGEHLNHADELTARKEAVKPRDLATLIYTSGTTGKPKGVMLSHDNIVSNVLSSRARVPFEEGAVALSFLPMCHIFERMIVYLYQYCGVTIYYGEGLDKISDNIKEVKPSVMTVVPRLLEKVYDKIIAKGKELTGVKKSLFFWAVDLGHQFEPYDRGMLYNLKLAIARKLIFAKWQEALGGNLELMVSGSAALQPRLTRIFGAAGIPVMEGYGLTETSPVITVNDQRNRGWKVGSVGKVIEGVEVKIASDGEILCKGPNVMLGYYKEAEKTAEVMTGDYFHTGDIGELDSAGFLRITDRKKEMFKTSGGKYVAPQLLENRCKQSLFIEQIMVVGEGQKMPAALIQLNFEFIEEWAQKKKIILPKNRIEYGSQAEVIARVAQEIELANQDFAQWEKIKDFRITPDAWTIEGGHLTPTMKLKRKEVKALYSDLYDSIYNESV
jgi:long-chain acyl-CoA synthetase